MPLLQTLVSLTHVGWFPADPNCLGRNEGERRCKDERWNGHYPDNGKEPGMVQMSSMHIC